MASKSTKKDLVQHIAKALEVSPVEAERVMLVVMRYVRRQLLEDTSVSLPGIGTLAVTESAARLGGNRRMGVFATRSPFRPNHLGLSSVRLERVEQSEALGPVLHVCGADLMDGTPIFDIKPYLPYTDSHPDAVGGFTDGLESRCLRVECPPRLLECIPADSREGLLGVLAGDPRPRYQEDPQRVYGMGFAGQNVRFTVDGETLTVHSIDPLEK